MAEQEIEVRFERTGNTWIDAGIVGLYRALDGKLSYLDVVKNSDQPIPGLLGLEVESELIHDSLLLRGLEADINKCLAESYVRLVDCYYNIATERQKKERGSVFLRTSDKKFVAYPKHDGVGLAAVICTGQPLLRPPAKKVAWGGAKGILPEPYSELQDEFEKFLKANSLTNSKLLSNLHLDGELRKEPTLKGFKISGRTANKLCFLTGNQEFEADKKKTQQFPFLGTDGRSFLNGLKDDIRIGVNSEFVAQFVPVIAFYTTKFEGSKQNPRRNVFSFFPIATSLVRIDEIADHLVGMRVVDAKHYFSNFESRLANYASKQSEIFTSFLYDVFSTLCTVSQTNAATQEKPSAHEQEFLDFEESDSIELPLDEKTLVHELTKHGQISFQVISSTRLSNGDWMPSKYALFNDVVYVARIFARLQRKVQHYGGVWRPICNVKILFSSLIDRGDQEADGARPDVSKYNTILRNRFCEHVLNRESVLSLIEKHAFHINRSGNVAQMRRVNAMLAFAELYEVERYGENPMEKERYKQLVETATWLGKNIAQSIAVRVKSETGESENRAKGAIHRLRKTRDIARFMDELARLQLRYGVQVPQDIFKPETIGDDFETFRGFCVVAALDRFIYEIKKNKPETVAAS